MKTNPDVLCAGIIVADHVCHPVSHVPAAGELVMTDKMLLTIGGCAANAAVDLTKMEVSTAVVGRVGDDAFGRIVVEMLREQDVHTTAIQTTPGADTSQTLIVNVAGQDRRFVHTFGANAIFSAADIPAALVKQCRVLYLGGYLAMPRMVQEELAPLFAAAQEAVRRDGLPIDRPDIATRNHIGKPLRHGGDGMANDFCPGRKIS